jgi:protein-tyrosine phosphatase
VPGLVDLHAHVIPGLDDGPATLEDSVALVRAAAEAGTRILAATPHIHSRFPDVHPEQIAGRLGEVREAVSDVDIELVPGGEVQLTWAAEALLEQLQLVSYGQRGRDVLIETPTSGILGIEFFLQTIHTRGYRVILAHPERGMLSAADLDRLESVAALGTLLQVNAESLVSARGELRGYARALCTRGLASVIASDGHSGTQRRPVTVLAAGVDELRRLVGEERAAWLSSGVPEAIVTGDCLPPEPEVMKSRGFFRRRR